MSERREPEGQAGVVSLLVRLLAEPAAAGRLVGQVEVVATGEVLTVRDEEDLVALARRLATGETSKLR